MRRRSVWLVLVGLLVIGLIAVGVQRSRAAPPPGAAAGQARGGAGGPVPVLAGAAERKDVPVHLDGVGTVQAYQTVTVRARVDGQLQRVAFSEGQDVKQGDLLALIDPRPFQATLGQAMAKKQQDEAVLTNTRLDLERYRVLVQQNLIQRQTLDTQEAAVRQLEAGIRGDQAAVDNANVQLGYTRIVAPISGRAGLRLVDQGNVVRASDSSGLVVLTQIQPIAVLFTVPEQNVGAINAEQAKHPLAVEALAADGQTVLDHGELLLVDSQIDSTTGTVRLKAIFPNAARQLWPGQFVNARLMLKVRQGGTVIPAPAVQRGPQGTFAYVIRQDNTVEMRAVKVSQTQAGEALLDDGVTVGERVVVEGQYKLQPGSTVVVQAPGGTPGGAGTPGGGTPGGKPGGGGGKGGGNRRPAEASQGREAPAGARP